MFKDKVTKEQLIADLKQLVEKTPVVTRNYYRQNGSYLENDWQKHFSTFRDFLKAADIQSKSVEPKELTIQEQSQIAHLQAKCAGLASLNKSLLKERGKYDELVEDLKLAVTALEPYEQVYFDSEDAVVSSPIAAVIKLSDWQIGEVINSCEVEGFGEFNFEIAENRVFFLVEKCLEWVAMHRKAGYNVDTLHIFSEADLVSGNIHYELEVTNEFPVTVAATKAGNLLATAISRLAPHFKEVVVWEISADNHGRMTRKNQAKQGALNNYSYLAHVICNEILRNHENVRIEMGDGTKLLADVNGKKFLLSHGHHIISQAGIPFYGMQRDKAREAVKRAKSELMFDYISMGHFHVPNIIDGNILINGSLTGTTEFDHMCGRHALPSQVSFMVHPKYGLFNWVAWNLANAV